MKDLPTEDAQEVTSECGRGAGGVRAAPQGPCARCAFRRGSAPAGLGTEVGRVGFSWVHTNDLRRKARDCGGLVGLQAVCWEKQALSSPPWGETAGSHDGLGDLGPGISPTG